ncbi:MAG: putative cytochrome c oxidase subunit, partial [Acidimicrobiia bacterium]|nr:putative cytochrome c oxidase subunit [Acidimicrobiia bacterium]
MTMTEARPGAVAALPVPTGPAPLAPTRGPAVWLTTADSSTIGRLFVGTSLIFGLGALGLGALAAIERMAPRDAFLDNAALRLLSLGVVGLAFMVVIPLWLGLAMAIVPLQVGARTVAFPRAAALSFWGWLGGTGLVIGSYAAHGGPDGSSSKAVGLFIVGLGLIALSLIVAAISVATTVLTLRVPGMYLDRVPFFAWSAMVAAVGLVLTLPVLIGLLIFHYVDHRYGGGAMPASLLGSISWTYRQPTTLLIALPVLGLVADVVPVFARTRVAIPEAVYGAVGLGAVLGFGAWVLDAFIPSVRFDFLFQAVSVLSVLPVLIVFGVVGLTLKSGKPKVGAPLIGAVTSLLLLLAGTVIAALV